MRDIDRTKESSEMSNETATPAPEKVRGNETFASVAQRRISRRAFLKHAAAGSAAGALMVLTSCAQSATRPAAEEDEPTEAAEEPTEAAEEPTEAAEEPTEAAEEPFTPIESQTNDEVVVPAGYVAATLLRWGDPIMADAPEFDPDNQSAEAQEKQFGYNCDFVGFFPLPQGSDSADSGLLGVNHEYTNPDIMFADYDVEAGPTKEQADVELAAHGMAVVEIRRNEDGTWEYDPASSYNRRLTAGSTEMTITGPAAGHDLLKTSDDDTGTRVIGTLNNCSGGKTPWGTYVSAEENFHQYFSNLSAVEEDNPARAIHERYGLPEEVSRYQWDKVYDRFDLSKEPNEPFRFGWVVEVDPYDPESTPKKRTALGRFRHEAATFVLSANDKMVAYSGDDERFEYIYKFVSEATYDAENREANMDILDEGTLYVAKFNDDGSGEWLPLVFGEGPLTEANGFTSQGDVLVKTRLAADELGATPMDRPEDMETNPVNQKVYVALTNNDKREDTNPMNPRAENLYGHVLEITEENDDHGATSFTWDIFLLCGDPEDESTYFADFDKSKVSPISCPDNVTFDRAGNLWIATDGQPGTLNVNDGCFMVPVEGPQRGFVQQFFSAVAGSEVCGPEFTPDDTTLFLAIQHPGEGGTFEEPVSTWPDGDVPPRPSVVVVYAEDGRPISTTA
jgi:hypothetical protein